MHSIHKFCLTSYCLLMCTIMSGLQLSGQNFMNIDWLEHATDSGYSGWRDQVSKVLIDGQSNTVMIGFFGNDADFTGDTTVSDVVHGLSDKDIFIAKYSPTDSLMWVSVLHTQGDAEAKSFGMDASDNIYVCGYFSGSVDFDADTSDYWLTSAGKRDMFIAKYSSTGSLIYAKRLGSTLNDEGSGIWTDATGNCYVTGSFSLTVDFNPGSATNNLIASNYTNPDAFVAKYDNQGNYQWAFKLGTSGVDYGLSVFGTSSKIYVTGVYNGVINFNPSGNANSDSGTDAGYYAEYSLSGAYIYAKKLGNKTKPSTVKVDASGNIYVAGSFSYLMNASISASSNYISTPATYDINAFFLKANSSRALIFAGQISTTASAQQTECSDITIDGNNNVFVSGLFVGTADFNPSASATAYRTALDYIDAYIAKYSSTGAFLDVVTTGGSAGSHLEKTNSLAIDNNGVIRAGGYFAATSDFDPGSGTYIITENNSAGDGFLWKLNSSDMSFVNAFNIGKIEYVEGTIEYAKSIAVNADGSSFMAGEFVKAVNLTLDTGVTKLQGSYFSNIYIAYYRPDGIANWVFTIGNTGPDFIWSIKADSLKNVYVFGTFYGEVDFDPDTSEYLLDASNNWSLFIAKYDSLGTLVFAKKIASHGLRGYMDIDANGNMFICGTFLGSVDLDPSSSVYYISSAAGSYDGYVAKYTNTGQFVAGFRFGGVYTDNCKKIVIDEDGNVVIVAQVTGTVDMNPAAATNNVNAVNSDPLFAKYTNNLAYVFAKNIRIESPFDFTEVEVDGDNNIYIAGIMQDSADFDPSSAISMGYCGSSYSPCFAKYTPSGNLIFHKNLDFTGQAFVDDLTVDTSDNNIYMIGRFHSPNDFNPDTPVFMLNNFLGEDAFIARFSSLGNFVQASAVLGTDTVFLGDIEISADGAPMICGNFEGYIDADPDEGDSLIYSDAMYSTFYARYENCTSVSPPMSVTICGGDTLALGEYNLWQTGDYVLVYSNTAGCDSIQEIHVDVNAIEVDFGITWVQCYGESNGSLEATPSGGLGALSMEWNTGDTAALIDSLMAGTYAISVTDSFGCVMIQSIVLPQPDSISFNASIVDVPCSNQNSGSISLSPTGGWGDYSFLWNDNQTSTQIIDLVSGNYLVTVADSNGCSNTAAFTVEALQDTLPINIGSDTSICFGDSLLLSGPAALGTYLWSTLASSQQIIAQAQAGYTLQFTDTGGCVSFDSIYIDQLPRSQNFIQGDEAYCTGLTTELSGPADAQSYQWSTSDTTTSILVGNSGSYILNIEDVNGCNAADTIVVYELPIPSFSLGNDTMLCLPQLTSPFVLTGPDSSIYQWSTGSDSQSVVVNLNGIYSLKFLSPGFCRWTDSINIAGDTCLGVNETNLNTVYSVFPNPNDGVFKIKTSISDANQVSVLLYSADGSLVQSNLEVETWIDLSFLSAGVYCLKINSPSGDFVQRVVITD